MKSPILYFLQKIQITDCVSAKHSSIGVGIKTSTNCSGYPLLDCFLIQTYFLQTLKFFIRDCPIWCRFARALDFKIRGKDVLQDDVTAVMKRASLVYFWRRDKRTKGQLHYFSVIAMPVPLSFLSTFSLSPQTVKPLIATRKLFSH